MPFPHAADPRVSPAEDPGPEVSEVLAKTLGDDRGIPLAIFRTMARHPGMLKRFNVLGGFFLTRGELAARDRELLVLRTAWRSGSEYEWAQHVVIGARSGLTEDEIARVARPGLAGEWPAADAALLRAADEILDQADIADATWSELSARHSETQIMELAMLVGFYRMTAGFLNATGVRREAGLPGWPAGADPAENGADPAENRAERR
jgi:alkylhydroperoxidase family enzyme